MLLEELEMKNLRELEDVIIEAIYAGELSGFIKLGDVFLLNLVPSAFKLLLPPSEELKAICRGLILLSFFKDGKGEHSWAKTWMLSFHFTCIIWTSTGLCLFYCSLQDVINGKLDQWNHQLEIHRAIGRDIRPEDIKEIASTLQDWCETCENMLYNVDSMISMANQEREKHIKHRNFVDTQVRIEKSQ